MGEQSENAAVAERLLRRVNRLKELVVTQGDGYLVVDASALVRGDLDVRLWHLYPEENGDWTHGPSGVTAPLGASLWAIACTYDVDPGVE